MPSLLNQGNIGPLSPTSIAGSNLIYSSRNQDDLGAGAQMHILSASSQNLPERPDQPDCRYYMNTGTCKYGADCKFHHPKERIAQSAASNIGPLGLPSRPVSYYLIVTHNSFIWYFRLSNYYLFHKL